MNAAFQRIEASEKQVAAVLSDDYSFTIPPYQRPYAWELEQAIELLDDLLDAMDQRASQMGFTSLVVLYWSKSLAHRRPGSSMANNALQL